jgi:hypothetical protein
MKGRIRIRLSVCVLSGLVVCLTPILIFLEISIDNLSSQYNQKDDDISRQGPNYVTVILPSVVNQKGRIKRLQAISQTWGSDAGQIVVTDENTIIPHDAYTEHPPIVVPNAVARPNEGVPRLKFVISQVHNLYDPDFAFFVNDHTFVIPDHVSKFLGLQKHRDPSQHLYAGHALKSKNSEYAFNSGASGYLLSRHTMETLISKWESGDELCDSNNKFIQGNPGLILAQCLHSIGVDPIDTRDNFYRHKFHAFGIIRETKLEVDEWYLNKHEGLSDTLGKDLKYEHRLQKGEECCSHDTISFHYVEYKETLVLFAILEKLRLAPDTSDEDLKRFVVEKWPVEKKDIGGYAHNLPPLKKKEVWCDFLKVLRNIA